MRAEADDLLESLREENEALLVRVAELEATRDEYRRQMAGLLNSTSWRVTAPLRSAAAQVRLVRRRLRRLPDLLAPRQKAPAFSTAGLFPPQAPPPGGLVTAASPLLARPEPAAPAPAPRLAGRRSDARVLVLAHVYYPEVWFDIEDRLVRIPEPFDLVVSLVEGRTEGLERELAVRLPQAILHRVPNLGRDLGSLVELANGGVFEGYDAILKVHTKRSPHRVDGDAWRVALLDGLLPSPEGVRRILDLLRCDRSVGLVVPTDHAFGAETWGSNRELVEALAARIPFAFDPEALRYPAGSMYWARPWLLQRLADLRLGPEHFEPEASQIDGSTAHALERFVGVAAQVSGLEIVEGDEVAARLRRARRRPRRRPTVLAFYLPQFHRIPENDAWWGEGFTDWVNVARARPLYAGHLQPAEPGELGRYDLADAEVLRRQAALAAEYGVDGFVVYRYWFDGRTLLDRPLRNLLDDPTIEFPFALCWANENWTRRWDGLDSEVLVAQRYGEGWADRFYDDLLPALGDPRYLRVGERPLLIVYRIGQVERAGAAIARWKERAKADGFGGLHVLAVAPPRHFEGLPPGIERVLDGLVQFPPLSGIGLQSVKELAPGRVPDLTGDVYSYEAAVESAELPTTGLRGLRVHPAVMPGWDNTPRRAAAAYVFHGANPLSFRRWLARARDAAVAAGEPALVFVNAWNEWAEGARLEPDARFGRAYLEAVRDVVGVRRAAAVAASPARAESVAG
ncbi:MAG TPA: glycoside hydrolase family 99-like domain-containing protein [Gaiellaceae bacterium]|nr:glycoside hydrolase family 99-like domain-containing protein [Gaiellaceae bacterium]